jgi:Cft2 family RNA processing exonuclease
VDTASRVLEILLMLEAMWKKKRLTYPLVFLSKMASTVLQFAASQLEFLSAQLQKGFTDGARRFCIVERDMHS